MLHHLDSSAAEYLRWKRLRPFFLRMWRKQQLPADSSVAFMLQWRLWPELLIFQNSLFTKDGTCRISGTYRSFFLSVLVFFLLVIVFSVFTLLFFQILRLFSLFQAFFIHFIKCISIYHYMSFQHIPPDTFSIVSTYASYIFL